MAKVGEIVDFESWGQAFIDLGGELLARITDYLPQLFAATAILFLGWLLARAVEIATGRALQRIGLDRAAARLQLTGPPERSEMRDPASRIIGRATFWIVMLAALLSAIEKAGLTALTATIDRLLAYIPDLLGAGLILLLGVLAARVAGAVARSAASAAGLQVPGRVGLAVQWLVIALVAVVAAEQLGIATEILIAPLTAVVGSITLSAGLAFALGARPIVTHILAGHFLRRSLPAESLVVVRGEQGLIESVGATETRLRGDSKSWSVPNGHLLDDVVTWV